MCAREVKEEERLVKMKRARRAASGETTSSALILPEEAEAAPAVAAPDSLIAAVQAAGVPVPSSMSTTGGLKSLVEQVWQENERRRAAMMRLFSTHADLAPAGAVYRMDLSRSWAGFPAGFKRRCPFRSREGKAEIELEQLPDSMLSYVYAFAPRQVCRDLAVSKRFLRCLTKAERVDLNVRSGAEVTASSLMRFEHGVHLVGKRCWGLCDQLTCALTAGWSALIALDLSDNELNDEATRDLSRALVSSGRNLTSLSLCDNNISAVGAQSLGAALVEFKKLEKLVLTGNRLGQEGARYLADGLDGQQGVATRLTHLGLGGNAIGLKGVEALLPVFMPPGLAHGAPASKGSRGIGGGGRAGGGRAEEEQSWRELHTSGVLQKLDFSACSLGPDGMAALAPLLAVRVV